MTRDSWLNSRSSRSLFQDFTRDRRELEDSLSELYTSGGTSLLDAIIATADYANEKGKQRRKAIVVITDGLERNSSVKEREVMEAIKEDKVQVYLVGFIDEGGCRWPLWQVTGQEGQGVARTGWQKRLRRPHLLSEGSGWGSRRSRRRLPRTCARSMSCSYYPSNEKLDGSFRQVKVVVTAKDNRRVIARTRQGYYAKGDEDRGSGQPQAPNQPITFSKMQHLATTLQGQGLYLPLQSLLIMALSGDVLGSRQRRDLK